MHRRMRTYGISLITVLATHAIATFIFLLGGMQATAAQGFFTNEQAKRGAAAYDANCATCHGAELKSADREVPGLSDKSFKFSWTGKSVGEKFQLIRDTMPPEEKRSLGDQAYLDIVAYILQFNKIPAGGQELTPDLEALKKITIPAPP